MLNTLTKLFAPAPERRRPSVPAGTRYYVIGDIHGRLDLYEPLIAEIEKDDASSRPAESHAILLGDLVDRGPDSAGVIARTREWQTTREVRVLAGNHEEMFLQAFEKPSILRHFLKHGGRETLLSFGLSKDQFNKMSVDEMHELLPELVPQDVRDYVASFEEIIVAGDYAFVHAGIDPSLPLEEQKRSDMLWIRDRFLNHQGPLSKVVVHGHTIFDKVMDCGNRIGIDTGAFRSGVLTALVLEGEDRRVIQAKRDEDGSIGIVHPDTED